MQSGLDESRKLSRRVCCVLIGLVGLVLTPAALAEKPLPGTLPTMDPRPLGLGGALRASPSGTSGVYLNPASIAMVPLYHLELMYQYTGGDALHMGGVSVVDSITSMIAAGLSFNYSRIAQPKTDHEVYDGRLALASGIGEMVFIGLTGRYLHVTQNTGAGHQGPGGVSALPSSGNQQVDGFTFDAGAAFRLGDTVSVGVSGNNLTNTGSVFAPIQLGGGVSLALVEILTVEADVVLDFSTHEDVNEEIHGGVDLFLANHLALRAGYIYDFYFGLNTVCAGVGYIDSAFSLEAGFLREIVDEGRMAFAFGFKYFVN